MAVYGLVGDPVLSSEDLRRVRMRLEELLEVVGPKDARGILQLSQVEQDHVTYFMDWLQDAFGGDDDDT
jgi:hypothetical protein